MAKEKAKKASAKTKETTKAKAKAAARKGKPSKAPKSEPSKPPKPSKTKKETAQKEETKKKKAKTMSLSELIANSANQMNPNRVQKILDFVDEVDMNLTSEEIKEQTKHMLSQYTYRCTKLVPYWSRPAVAVQKDGKDVAYFSLKCDVDADLKLVTTAATALLFVAWLVGVYSLISPRPHGWREASTLRSIWRTSRS